MSFKATWYQDKFRKKVSNGFAGYPLATIAYYGPDNQRASKVAVGIIQEEGGDAAVLERWHSESEDVRTSPDILKEVLDFVSRYGVKSVIVAGGILGCPHEEGKDYPEGEKCPACKYWENRDRFNGNVVH
jgi:hypothetical protein